MQNTLSLTLLNEHSTLSLGKSLSPYIKGGMVIYLHGDLGAGKTTLTRGLLQGLGYEGRVKSPTYTLVEPYFVSGLSLYHFDLYRFSDPVEWEEAGFRDYFHPHAVCIIEWPEKAIAYLPIADWTLTLSLAAVKGRIFNIVGVNEAVLRHLLEDRYK